MNWLKNIWNKIKSYFQNKEKTIEDKVKTDVDSVKTTGENDIKAVEDTAVKVVTDVQQGL